MELERNLVAQAEALSSLTERRRAVWRDSVAHDFEQRFLSPLSQVLDEYLQAVRAFAEEVEEAANQLRD